MSSLTENSDKTSFFLYNTKNLTKKIYFLQKFELANYIFVFLVDDLYT